MSKAPYIKIFIENSPSALSQSFPSKEGFIPDDSVETTDMVELSEYIEGMAHTFSIYDDNRLELSIRTKYASTILELIDNPKFSTGRRIVFYYGYLDGDSSDVYTARITNLRTKYATSISVSLLGTDRGTELKAFNTGRVWENMTSSEIAAAIADKHGMAKVIDPTTKKHAAIPQGDMTDMEFLQELTGMEDYYLCYATGFTLHFVRQLMNNEAKYKFVYGDTKEVISFTPTHNENNTKLKKVKAVGFDPIAKKLLEVVSDGPKLGKFDIEFGERGDAGDIVDSKSFKIGADIKQSGTNTKKVLSASSDITELGNKANKTYRRDSFRALTAELVLEGKLNIIVGELATVEGVARKHQGNWLISEVLDRITGGGQYITTLKMEKDGTAKAISVGSGETGKNVNDTVGENKEPKKVIKFGEFGSDYGDRINEDKLLELKNDPNSDMNIF